MKVIEFAQKRLEDEEIDNKVGGAENEAVLVYWRAYLDGAKAQQVEDTAKSNAFIAEITEKTASLCACVSSYAKQMNELIDKNLG